MCINNCRWLVEREDKVRSTHLPKATAKNDVEIINPRGMPHTPITDQDVRDKFHRLAEPLRGDTAAREAAEAWFHIDAAESLSPAMALLVTD